ncbi:MAG TPA: inositol monophosphatase family protein [Candidatus Kapabacteria bacterium]|nr:inositol monophosphatase family protein [Candidatus Kapabacteria bacterium]
MKMDYEKILAIAREAALTAGNYLKENFDRKPAIEYKSAIELVTERDRESQQIIYQIIKKHFPNHSILGEEDLDEVEEKDLLWMIDPIDGTTNFAHSLPIFSVSIAFLVEGKTQVGVVFAPILGEMFYTIRGGGAFLDKKQIHVSQEKDLRKSLLCTGFPYDIRESENNNLNHFNKFVLQALAVRRLGSAAIDLCYTAAGRLDGFWELKLKPWDTAAAFLMVEEAGGIVTDFSNKPFDPLMKECLASNSLIHSQMLEIIDR